MRSVELFSGVGGLALGVSLAGFNHEAVIELEDECCQTIRTNQKNKHKTVLQWPLYQSDVRQFDFAILSPEPDLLTGGPPCQPFSLGGKCKGHRDKRDMFPEVIRAVRDLRPKAFFFENVKGLMRPAFLNYFEYVRLQLTFPFLEKRFGERWFTHHERLEKHFTNGRHAPEYRVVVHCFNAADYGVPQKRERVILVGLRSDINAEWAFPEPTHSDVALLHAKWRTGSYWDYHLIAKKHRPPMPHNISGTVERLSEDPGIRLLPWVTIRDTVCDLPAPSTGKNKHLLNHYVVNGARTYAGHTGSPIDEPAKALKAGNHGVPGGENMLITPDGNIRYFTIRECARLQCFPDDYIFPGSWTSNTRQLGNAVPVLFSKVIAESLKVALIRAQPRP